MKSWLLLTYQVPQPYLPTSVNKGYKQDGRGGTILGFGASLYDCSLVMLQYLLLDTSIVKHKVVLELGCGTGFLSIALGIIGEKSLL